MSDRCCAESRSDASALTCPVSGFRGDPVAWRTVAALVRGRLPRRQEFRLCLDPACEVVYYGAGGDLLTTDDLSVLPGFKSTADGLVCYCFLHRRSEIERDGKGLYDSIASQVRAGRCACEVRSPSGQCCLGEVERALRQLRAGQEVR